MCPTKTDTVKMQRRLKEPLGLGHLEIHGNLYWSTATCCKWEVNGKGLTTRLRSWDEKGRRNGALKRMNTWLRGPSPHQEVLMPAKPVQKAEEEDTLVPWGSERIGQMKDTAE